MKLKYCEFQKRDSSCNRLCKAESVTINQNRDCLTASFCNNITERELDAENGFSLFIDDCAYYALLEHSSSSRVPSSRRFDMSTQKC